MKANWLAIALMVVGALFLYQGLTAKRQDTLIDIGSFRATVDRKDSSPMTTLLGAAAMAGGLFLIVRSNGRPGSPPG